MDELLSSKCGVAVGNALPCEPRRVKRALLLKNYKASDTDCSIKLAVRDCQMGTSAPREAIFTGYGSAVNRLY
jgi:hypothetical protein